MNNKSFKYSGKPEKNNMKYCIPPAMKAQGIKTKHSSAEAILLTVQGMQQLGQCSSKRYIQVLITGTHEWEFIWKQGFEDAIEYLGSHIDPGTPHLYKKVFDCLFSVSAATTLPQACDQSFWPHMGKAGNKTR